MHTTIGIDIDAPPELVFALAHDVTRWERLLPHYTRSRALRRATDLDTTPNADRGTDPDADRARICEFVARRPFIAVLGLGIPVAWRSRTWSEPDTRRLRFVHVAGATRGMDVTWTIEPSSRGGTRVDIAHDFAPRLPLLAAFVDRVFTRPIASRTLATFKALAEAVHETSGMPAATNPST